MGDQFKDQLEELRAGVRKIVEGFPLEILELLKQEMIDEEAYETVMVLEEIIKEQQ